MNKTRKWKRILAMMLAFTMIMTNSAMTTLAATIGSVVEKAAVDEFDGVVRGYSGSAKVKLEDGTIVEVQGAFAYMPEGSTIEVERKAITGKYRAGTEQDMEN